MVRHMEDFKTGIPIFTSQVWKDLSKEFNHVWDSRCWYTNVKYNRRDILTEARRRMGIIAESPKINISCFSNDFWINDSVLLTSGEVIHCKNELNK